jgi:hypothetical protein
MASWRPLPRRFGAPSRFEAFKAWAAINASAMPFCHQRLATLTVKPAGNPDGEPVELNWSYAEDEVLEHLELTHDKPPRGEEEPWNQPILLFRMLMRRNVLRLA